jgi:signal transduction histidine kinase
VLALREQVNRDLHDDVLQSIYAVGLTLEGVKRNTAAPQAALRLGEAIEHLNNIMRNIRLYILQPTARLQDSQDVVSALHALVRSAHGNQALQVDAAIDARALPDLHEEHAHHLLQIAREALSNMQRHARARSVAVTLRRDAHGTHLSICDDGCGFDTRAPGAGGHGLRNMAARAELMGARVEIQSAPGQGTRVLLELPSAQVSRAQAA